MLLIHCDRRRIYNFKKLSRWMYKSVKIFNFNDFSSLSDSTNFSDSSESDSDGEVKKNMHIETKKSSHNENLNNTTENLNRLLNLFSKKMSKTNSNASKITYITKKVQFKNPKTEENNIDDSFDKQLKDAVKSIATVIGDNSNKIESELLNKIDTQNQRSNNEYKETFLTQEATSNLSDILTNMKVIKQRKSKYFNKNKTISRSINRVSFYQSNLSKINLNFCVEDYFQFLKDLPIKESRNVDLAMWKVLQSRELKLLVINTPQNIFQEMIEWTEKGMIWKFPINNEQDMEEEEKIHFSEHIFLEHNLKHWCPEKGPLRHFMELVCIGLSKNPYMSVNEKIGHIAWYRNYFEDKREILKDYKLFNTEAN